MGLESDIDTFSGEEGELHSPAEGVLRATKIDWMAVRPLLNLEETERIKKYMGDRC